MDNSLKILLVEDSDADADLLIRSLKGANINFTHLRVWHKEDYIARINDYHPDLIIADHTLPQFNGMEAFRLLKNEKKNIPFILVTGTLSESFLAEYAKEGIDDYLLKDNLLRLPSAIENVVNKKRIEKLYTDLEGAYKEIKDSINYARIIQDTMFSDASALRETFPKSFILFKPKDVLSGDFYWFKKKENRFFIAVADCTGHGIPGALLSMLGFNMLYEAVDTKKTIHPSEVLDILNKQFRRISSSNKTKIHDGMDLLVCSIDLENRTLMYAGANRPLFIVRDEELLEFKPDRVSISGTENLETEFTNNTIKIKTGDRIFLFSDGYIGQFHFKTNKKITSNRFRKLLIRSSSLPVDTQENLINVFFDEWKGDKEQVDDVLLICIQIL
jgi:sigma-B regulation protein RsbU (phosphoserine phosphatase)